MTTAFWIDVCFLAEEPVVFWIGLDYKVRTLNGAVAHIVSIAISLLGVLGRNENSPVKGREAESLSVLSKSKTIAMMQRDELFLVESRAS